MLAEGAAVATHANHPLGQGCALLAAVVWAYALVLFKLSGERLSPLALNLLKNTVGLTLLLITIAFQIAFGFERFAGLGEHIIRDVGLLMLSGILGIAIADTLFFRALNLIGVGLISIVDCCYAPVAILFAWLLLGEKLTVFHYVGAGLIVAGVFTASHHTLPVHRTRVQIIGGMLLAVLAVGLMAFGIVMVKPILDYYPLIWATALRLVGGQCLLMLLALHGPGRRAVWSVFRPSPTWKYALPGAVLGAYVSLVLWVAGFKFTYASVAAVLNQTTVVFASILAALVLKERFGLRQIAALILALGGVVVTCYDQLQKALAGQ
jgi:drug/metabolite transporter (DMT)-like permease